ncbi:isopeptide-forming domain-containing fimbrial protein [Mordavella massiliensis]|uniref:DUF11 domain-containing protein n=1 Tax=Mordavella massiliensis TaxID=1871024 RepID=A0A938XAS9_9CLOT|nr:isopeptide-forming domain-containing fimbrial protein [Mordavella massiliensis]MBM6948046.1 DUF11 domain-containing protein [Mordavella massiliensis]
MREDVKSIIRRADKRRKRRRKIYAGLALLAVLVAGFVSWKLILPGIALGGDAYCGREEHTHSGACYEEVLICGQEESAGHTHTEACYTEERHLTCAQEESAGHTHTEACYDEAGNLICAQEESAGHTHTEACYTTEQRLTCGQEERAGHTHTDACYQKQMTCGMEEHTHTLACHSNPNAVESQEEWTAAFKDYQLTGEWGKDAAYIAKTQVGYTESESNYTVNEDETTNGYTRYGAWNNDPYGDWDLDFAAFVLSYAGVPDEQFPINANGLNEWTTQIQNAGYYVAPDGAAPESGDLVVLEKDGQDRAQQMGIVSEVRTDKDGNVTEVKVIEGNCDDAVKENTYNADDKHIVAYGLVSKAYEAYSQTGEKESAKDNTEAPEEDGAGESDGEQTQPAGKQAVNLWESKDAGNTGGDVSQRITVDITPKPGSATEAKTGQELGVSVIATYSGANWAGKAEIWIRLGEMPEGMSLAGFVDNKHTVAIDGNHSTVLELREEKGISYIVFDIPEQGDTVTFNLDFITENGIMPEKTTLAVEIDTEKTRIAEDAWKDGLDHASEPVELTWTADFDWNDVIKEVNGEESNTIKYYEDVNQLSGTLIYTISAIGNNHDTYGAIWTDHIELTDTIRLTGSKMWFPKDAEIILNQRKIVVKTADGDEENIAYFVNDYTGNQKFEVKDMQWVVENGKRVGITYTIEIDNQNWNSSDRDREQSNLDLDLRVNAKYLELSEDFGNTFSNENDRITNEVTFKAVPCVKGVNPEESKDSVFTTLEKTEEEGRLTKTVAGKDGEKPEQVEEGDTLTYTISFENTGHTAIALRDENGQAYKVTDTLPVYLTLTKEQEENLPVGAEAKLDKETGRWTITWDPTKTEDKETLETGETFTFDFEVMVKSGSGEQLNNNSAITNMASYKGFTGRTTVYFGEGKIKVEKTSDKNRVANGGNVTYTITISNTGGADIKDPQTFTDTLPKGLTFVSSQIGEQSVTASGTYTITSGSGQPYGLNFNRNDQELTWTLNSLNKGDSVSFSYTCTVNTDEMEGTTGLTNTIEHDGDGGDDQVTIGVDYPLELEKIVQQDSSKVYESGSEFDYTITLKNDPEHPSQQESFDLVDTLPEGMIPIDCTLQRIENDSTQNVSWEDFAKDTYQMGNAENVSYSTQINGDQVSVSKTGNQIVLTWHIDGKIEKSVSKNYRVKLILSEEQQDGEVYDFRNVVTMDDLEASVTVYGGEGCTLEINKNIYFADPDYQNGADTGFIGDIDGKGLDSQNAIDTAKALSFEITGIDEEGQPITFGNGEKTLIVKYADTGCANQENYFFPIGTTLEPGTYTIKEVFPDMTDTGYELYSAEYVLKGDVVLREYPSDGVTVTIENGQAKSVILNNTYGPEGEASIDIQKSVFGIAEKNGDTITPLSSKDEISAEPGTGEYLISYNISVINTGKQDVIIEEIIDTLPEGMEYVGMASKASAMFDGEEDTLSLFSDSLNLLNTTIQRGGGTIDKIGNATGKLTFKTTGYSYEESVKNKYMILAHEGDKDSILSFLMICSIDADKLEENVALTNTVSVAARGRNGERVYYRDAEDISSRNTPYDAIQNIGSSEDMGTEEKGGYEYRVVSSSVSVMPTKQLVPGIKKEAVAYRKVGSHEDFKEIGDDGIIDTSNAVIKWKITIYNDGTLDMKDYTIEDTMTSPFTLLTKSNKEEINNPYLLEVFEFVGGQGNQDGYYKSKTGYPMALSESWIEEISSDKNQNTYQISIPDSNDNYTIEPGEYAELTLYTYCAETNYKTYMNTATILPNLKDAAGNPIELNALKVKDGRGEVVYDEDGTPVGVKASDNVYAMGAYGSRAWKEVEEKGNPDNHGEGSTAGGSANYIQVSAADDVIYRNNIQNISQTSFKDMVIIDRLPDVNDIGVVNTMDQRGSQFKVSWAEGLELYKTDSDGNRTRLNAGEYTIEFSAHPINQAFSESDFEGANADNWHNTWQDGDTSFRIVMDSNFKLNQQETLIIQYGGKIADDAGSLEIAWNSFGYRYTGTDAGAPTLTAEPPKVGVMMEETYELPGTGGFGPAGYLAGGAILTAASCLTGGYRMRRRRERRRR